MIFSDLQNAVVARLNWDAYFADPDKGATVLAENRMDLIHELDASLARLGVCAVVVTPRVTPGENDTTSVRVVLLIHEIPIINRDTSGSQKAAQDLGAKAMALLTDWTPNEDMWSPLEFQGLELTDVDETYGRITWSAEFITYTMLELLITLLDDESDNVLINESGETLLVSPTDP